MRFPLPACGNDNHASAHMKNVLILGATSAIAHEVAKLYADEQAHLFLVARNEFKLETIAKDLIVRGAKVTSGVANFHDFSSHPRLLEQIKEKLGNIDVVLLAYGSLGNQAESEKNISVALQEIETNFLTAFSLLSLLAHILEAQGSGTLAVISSVAGDRGRQSNYIYGTAKGALNIFLQGLRNRLYKKGVHVLTIKPGFVDTPMTTHLKKGFLFSSSQKVGNDIYKAIEEKEDVLYTPQFWRAIMFVIRNIPEALFKRLNL